MKTLYSPALARTMEHPEKSYNESEAECLRLIGVIQDKINNTKTRTWSDVSGLNRIKIQLVEINDNF